MATNYKVLGQEALTAETATTVYTVPAATEAIVSTIVVCNRAAVANTFRIAIRPDGDTLANEHYIAYDVPIAANDATNLTIGVTMNAGDIITAYGGAASTLSVNVFGSEIS
jgi:glucose-6-phosphate dehydrogenase assembly protein OpcA